MDPFYLQIELMLLYFDNVIKEHKKSVLYLFAHNYSGFDGHFQVPALLSHIVSVEIENIDTIFHEGK